MAKKLTIEEFIQKARAVHGDKYDYSKSVYICSRNKVRIGCYKHGGFQQEAASHLQGFGCPQCKMETITFSIENFIEKSNKIHGEKYDYSHSKYKNNNSKVLIICKRHGNFFQTPHDHMGGHGCQSCYDERRGNTKRKSICHFVKVARKTHGPKYDYSEFKYISCMKNGIIICPIHGKFLQSPNSHCQGQGCPKCSESHGEKEVEKWLTIHKINHIRQKTFENCISPISHRKLRFDFFVPCKNTLIEYDGEQHFKIGKYIRKHKITKRDFEKIRFHDSLKTKYAKSNKIEIIRIPYTKKKSIPQILETKLL